MGEENSLYRRDRKLNLKPPYLHYRIKGLFCERKSNKHCPLRPLEKTHCTWGKRKEKPLQKRQEYILGTEPEVKRCSVSEKVIPQGLREAVPI